MFEAIAFYTFSIIVIGMFGIVVFSKNALYALSALAGGMIFISGFFFLLNAEFLGVVQIVVYTGAIMAVYAFGMMFFDTTRDVKENIRYKKTIYTLSILSSIFTIFVFLAPIYSLKIKAIYPSIEGVSNIQMIGLILFTKYLVPFELAAIMLLAAMIAGIVLVKVKMDETPTHIEVARGEK
ncbi:MAG: NADH-quinone oxidoreductase subunit J [Sulfurospirillaceae bacterium]|nr:NADH-quinone oxidoreductase subunit J [Sulfurospirillaceae bacterium]